MGRTSAWETYMRRAAAQLSRACAETAAGMSGGQTGIREIRELAGAMKDLTALHTALEGTPDPVQSELQVCFDRAADTWSE